jgi:hypothetical protein
MHIVEGPYQMYGDVRNLDSFTTINVCFIQCNHFVTI